MIPVSERTGDEIARDMGCPKPDCNTYYSILTIHDRWSWQPCVGFYTKLRSDPTLDGIRHYSKGRCEDSQIVICIGFYTLTNGWVVPRFLGYHKVGECKHCNYIYIKGIQSISRSEVKYGSFCSDNRRYIHLRDSGYIFQARTCYNSSR